MPLILLEGPRNSGKTYLISKLSYPTFKFDFTGVYGGLNLQADSPETHALGLGKEIMLHQLFHKGFLGKDLVVDRGILTNQSWGLYQDRVEFNRIYSEIDFLYSEGYFNDVEIILINSDFPASIRENKDHWDHLENDSERIKELQIFLKIADYMKEKGIKINRFKNNFDMESENRFLNLINSLICVES